MLKLENTGPVVGFETYSVDRAGNVYNKQGQKLKAEMSENGYLRVVLSKPKHKRKKMLVHRLVAEAFIPNENRLPQVNHIDRNKANNQVDNLEWCTALQNLKHSGVIEKGNEARRHGLFCVTTGEVFSSIKEAEIKYGLSHSNIIACCKGRRNTCRGLSWRYQE